MRTALGRIATKATQDEGTREKDGMSEREKRE